MISWCVDIMNESMVCDDITQFSTAELIDELISRGNSIHNIPESVGFARVITGMSNNRDDPSNHLDNPKDLVLANVYLGPCRILVVRE